MSRIAYQAALLKVGRSLPVPLVTAGDHHHCEACGRLIVPGIYPHHVVLTDKEVSRIRGRSLSHYRNARNLGGGIPFIREGRSIGYLLSDVIAHIEGLPRFTNTSQYKEAI